MAEAVVDIKAVVKGLGDIERLEKRMKGQEAQVAKLPGSLPKATNQIKRFGDQAKKTETQISGLTKSVRGFLTAAALLGTAKFVIGKTSELETQTRSLKVLTGELETAEKIIRELQQFSAITPFTSSELIDTTKRLAAFGIENEKLVKTTKQLADLSGATGAKVNELGLIYGQVMAKGKLQTEELYQFQERGIGLQDELQKMYQLSGDEFADAMRKGLVPAEAVEAAIERLTEKGGKYADGAISQSDTLAGKFSTLIDGIENIARTIGSVLSPALKAILNEAINVINAINTAINIGQKALRFGLDQGQQKQILDQARREAEEIVNLRKIKDPFERNSVFQEIAAQRESDLLDAYGFKTGKLQVEIEPVITENKIPDLLKQNTTIKTGGGSGRTGGGGSGKAAADEAAREAERVAEALRNRTQLVARLEKQIEIQQAVGGLAKEELEFELDVLEIQQKYGNLLADETNELVRQQIEKAKLLELDLARVEAQKDMLDAAGDEFTAFFKTQPEAALLNEELSQTDELLKGAYDTVANGLTSGIKGLIDGTKEWGDVLSDILGQLGSMFLQAGFNGLGTAMKIPGFADGGRPEPNKVSIVGERGPELFIPDSSGTVISNEDAFGAASAAMVRGGNSDVAGDDLLEMSDEAFAIATSAMQQSNAIRSGNTAAAAEADALQAAQEYLVNSKSTVKFDTFRVGEMDVVTREDAIRIGQQSAKQAEANVFKGLRNMPAIRSRSGIS